MKFFSKSLFVLALTVFAYPANIRADWQKVKSNTLAWLHAVYFVNQNRGWIAGSNGTLLITEDGGSSWTATGKFTEDTIRDIYFSDENHGWLLAEKDIYGGGGQFSPSSILETSDGGKTWEKVKLEGEGKERLVRIFFSKEGTGRTVGEAGTMFEMQHGAKVWKKQNIPVRYLLLDGSFLDQKKGLIVGGGGSAFFTEDSGNSWKPSVFAKKANAKLNSVFFINRNIGWTVGANGKIYSTNNGGKLWRGQNSGVAQNLFDVFFMNTAEGWAVGDEGTILHTTTAGNIWEEVSSNTKHKLERVFFNGKKVWVVGFGGTIMVYESEKDKSKKSAQLPVLQKRSFSVSQ